ncbi:unnamed protein product [Symbiodinium sp. CCMP2592]|nr:unnamed protein product [Symbiodinium sp. CCMP2592]
MHLDPFSVLDSGLATLTLAGGTLAFVSLLLLLPILVRQLGGLPAEHAPRKPDQDAAPPLALLRVTGALCSGVMANITCIVLTVQTETEQLTTSGYLLASECVGAVVGLLLFRSFVLAQLRVAYQLTAVSMIVGNGLYAWASIQSKGLLALFASRMITGVGAGSMYNSAMVMVHFARGQQKTPHMVLYQFFVAFGVLLGPALASVSLLLLPGTETKDALANCIMVVWGAGLWLAVVIVVPSDISTFEVQAGLTKSSVLEASEATETSELPETSTRSGTINGLALFLTLIGSATIRMGQRLLWESGSVIAVEVTYGWSASTAGLVFIVVVVSMAVAQYLFSQHVAGKYPDTVLLRRLEITQLVGVLLMFQPLQLPVALSVLQFMVASVLAYSSNAIWSGVLTSFCVKRSLANSFFSSENLMLLNQAAIFLGIAAGSTISRASQEVVQGGPALSSMNILAGTLLVGALLQLNLSLITISEISLDFFVAIVSLGLGLVIPVAALMPAWGGTGPSHVFTWHIVCMGMAWPCLSVLGYWSYNADLMSGRSKNGRRTIHMLCMLGVGVLSIAGYASLFEAHRQNGEGQFGGLMVEGNKWTLKRGVGRFIHVAIGYLVVLGVLLQAVMGLWKRHVLLNHDLKAVTWHGGFGRVLLTCGLVSTCIGVWLDINGKGGFPLTLKLGISATLPCLGALAFFRGPEI